MINGIGRIVSYMNAADPSAVKDRAEEMFANMDTNGDGIIDKAEFTEFGRKMAANIGKADKSEELFSKMDTDGDGQISKAEFEAFGEKMKGRAKEEMPVDIVSVDEAKNESISTLLEALDQGDNSAKSNYQNAVQQYSGGIDNFAKMSDLNLLG
ncbi:hypothetical protein TRIP_C20398 [Candidatus Zixiibacteriota bacterium]|nr:hypothetical protein TRIP_C20398 [candidate division Zixibacteria bacterium]